MNEVLPLIDDKKVFLLWFDSSSLNKFLTEFSPSCIDSACGCGVLFRVDTQKQPNGIFELDGKLGVAGVCGWINYDDSKPYNVYRLKIFLTASNTEYKVWKKIAREINNKLGRENKAWESFKGEIDKIRKRRVLSAEIILSELNRTNEMSQELRGEIANKLKSWKKLVKAELNPSEMELKKDCVCLELKKDNNGKMYFDYQKYKDNRPIKNNEDNKWKIYLKEEYRSQTETQVIYFEKFDKVEEKNENSAILISNDENKIKDDIHNKNRNTSDTSNKKNGLNGIKYEQWDMEEGKNGNSISDKNENINNKQSENDKKIGLEIKGKNKSEIKYKNPKNEQVTNFQRKPTALYIILAIVFIPLAPYFIYLAVKSYKSNCDLEKNMLQTLKNNEQENAKEDSEKNQNKNTDRQIPESGELDKTI